MLLTFQAKLAPCSMFYNAFDSWNWKQFNPGDSRSKSSSSKAFLGESGGVEANNAGETVEARLRLRARKTQPPMQYAMIGVFNLPSLLSKDLGAHEACPNGTCIWYCLIGDSLVNHFVSSLAAVLMSSKAVLWTRPFCVILYDFVISDWWHLRVVLETKAWLQATIWGFGCLDHQFQDVPKANILTSTRMPEGHLYFFAMYRSSFDGFHFESSDRTSKKRLWCCVMLRAVLLPCFACSSVRFCPGFIFSLSPFDWCLAQTCQCCMLSRSCSETSRHFPASRESVWPQGGTSCHAGSFESARWSLDGSAICTARFCIL